MAFKPGPSIQKYYVAFKCSQAILKLLNLSTTVKVGNLEMERKHRNTVKYAYVAFT